MAFRLAYSLLGDRHQSEDVVQDVYLTVFQSIRQLRDLDAFRTWFGRIISNRCKRLLRGRRPIPLAEVVEAGKDPSTDGLEEKAGRRLELRKALERVTDTDRTILTLREVMQFSYEEMAEVLDISVGTVKSRLANARRRLAEACAERGLA